MTATASPAARTPRKRVLIFIVAYEAETTLRSVLDRIPEDLQQHDTEVLVIDDSSQDGTFESGVEYSREKTGYPVRVLYNPENQGYGGNQKIGYQYAIQNDFDVVVLLHGDAQYAPECIVSLVDPILKDTADAVLGSRMLTRGGARGGGMPLYKRVGNRVLTALQCALLRTRLSEFHTGLRSYRVTTLAAIPFQYNTDDFHFDTEILIQILRGRYRISEVPIPTYYGDEVCRVNGLKYAWNVLHQSLLSRMQDWSLFYERKYDLSGDSNEYYDVKLGYKSSHTIAAGEIPRGARVLDIGCGPGVFDSYLKEKGCRITGIDRYPPSDVGVFESFHLWDEDRGDLPCDPGDYDVVLLLDFLEHLNNPTAFLDRLRHQTQGRQPKIVVSTGNVGFFVVRFQLLLGMFNYGKRGILDITHRRLYTLRALRSLFEQCGFRVQKIIGIPAPYPKALGTTRLAMALLRANSLLIRLSRGLFAYQAMLVAVPSPTVDALLSRTVRASSEKAREILTPRDVP